MKKLTTIFVAMFVLSLAAGAQTKKNYKTVKQNNKANTKAGIVAAVKGQKVKAPQQNSVKIEAKKEGE